MSYWNKLAGLGLVGALFVTPALADGRDRVVVQGPAPLEANLGPRCEFGRDANGTCTLPETMTIASRTHTTTQRPTTVRRVVSHAPQAHRTVAAQPRYDFSSFTGGVGTDIGTGFVSGGGRSIVVVGSGSARRFSGVPGRAFAISRASNACCH